MFLVGKVGGSALPPAHPKHTESLSQATVGTCVHKYIYMDMSNGHCRAQNMQVVCICSLYMCYCLLRSKAMETGNVNGAQMLHFVSVQATIVEALISNYDYIFSDDEPIFRADGKWTKV